MYGNPNTHVFTFAIDDAFRRVVNHALQAKAYQPTFTESQAGTPPKPGVFFVKDQGVYLLSAGKPGDRIEPDKIRTNHRLLFACYAIGHDPDKNSFESWYVGGDDFSEKLDIELLETAMISLDARKHAASGEFQIKVTEMHLYFESFIRRQAS